MIQEWGPTGRPQLYSHELFQPLQPVVRAVEQQVQGGRWNSPPPKLGPQNFLMYLEATNPIRKEGEKSAASIPPISLATEHFPHLASFSRICCFPTFLPISSLLRSIVNHD